MPSEIKKPAWFVITLSFGLLITAVVGYYYLQAHLVQKSFKSHIRENALLVTEMVRLNTETAVSSRIVIEEVIEHFLINTATFVDYLDSVEPFTDSELSAYAIENGLSGISVSGPDGNMVSRSRDNIMPETDNSLLPEKKLFIDPGGKFYSLRYTRKYLPGFIIISHPASGIEKLREKIGLQRLLKTLNTLPGFAYVRKAESLTGYTPGSIQTVEQNGVRLMETSLMAGNTMLIIGLESEEYFNRINQLWKEVGLFSLVTAILGLFFSGLVYYYQKKHLKKTQHYERQLATNREEAAIGRASATITHEIRNPLNAIHMGLQRLEMEAGELADDHRHLIVSMKQAVRRTNGIITELNRFAMPVTPDFQPVRLDKIVGSVLVLYKTICQEKDIRLQYQPKVDASVMADATLLETLFENLILNAIEAQPGGGFLDISLTRSVENAEIRIRNSGFVSENLSKIAEPYFTTKTTGSGLGLSIAQKIIRAHNGNLTFQHEKPDMITITITLPSRQIAKAPTETTETG